MTLGRSSCHGSLCFVQFTPPSWVESTVPNAPTAKAALSLRAWTPRRCPLVPEFLSCQELPVSVVVRIVPPPPTAKPWRSSANDTEVRAFVVPLFCRLQLLPQFAVWRINPNLPTAQPCPLETT